MAITVRIPKDEYLKDNQAAFTKYAPAGHFANSWADSGDVMLVDYEPAHLGPGAAPAKEKKAAAGGKRGASKSEKKGGSGRKKK
jgi:hypothetical protein